MIFLIIILIPRPNWQKVKNFVHLLLNFSLSFKERTFLCSNFSPLLSCTHDAPKLSSMFSVQFTPYIRLLCLFFLSSQKKESENRRCERVVSLNGTSIVECEPTCCARMNYLRNKRVLGEHKKRTQTMVVGGSTAKGKRGSVTALESNRKKFDYFAENEILDNIFYSVCKSTRYQDQ